MADYSETVYSNWVRAKVWVNQTYLYTVKFGLKKILVELVNYIFDNRTLRLCKLVVAGLASRMKPLRTPSDP